MHVLFDWNSLLHYFLNPIPTRGRRIDSPLIEVFHSDCLQIRQGRQDILVFVTIVGQDGEPNGRCQESFLLIPKVVADDSEFWIGRGAATVNQDGFGVCVRVGDVPCVSVWRLWLV